MAQVPDQDCLKTIKQEILNLYKSLDEQSREIFNAYMIERGNGVDYDEVLLFDKFREIKEISKIIGPGPIYHTLSYLLGYKKIQWLQGKQATESLIYFKKIHESINVNTTITK